MVKNLSVQNYPPALLGIIFSFLNDFISLYLHNIMFIKRTLMTKTETKLSPPPDTALSARNFQDGHRKHHSQARTIQRQSLCPTENKKRYIKNKITPLARG